MAKSTLSVKGSSSYPEETVVLEQQVWDRWLDPELVDVNDIDAMLSDVFEDVSNIIRSPGELVRSGKTTFRSWSQLSQQISHNYSK